MRRKMILASIITAVLCLSMLSLLPGKHTEQVTLFAASSTAPALSAFEEWYEAEHDIDLRVVTNGSGALRSQIDYGADADLFLAASVEDTEHLRAKEHVPLLGNRLWFVTSQKRCATEISELNACRRIVLGDPDTVPAGRYAQRALESFQMWNQVENSLLLTQNVRQGLMLLESGDADAGFVYETELSEDVFAVEPVSIERTGSIVYPLLRFNDAPEVRDVYEALQGENARRFFEEKGFLTYD